jgi:hypothetical protein
MKYYHLPIQSLMVIGAMFSFCFAQTNFYPAVKDTSTISFDVLGLSQKWRDVALFSCTWTRAAVYKDSITWYLDGKAPNSGDVSIIDGPGTPDKLPNYSTGTTMSLLAQADPSYFQGIHRIDLAVKFGDSIINGTWYYRYYKTKYKEIRAHIIVDSFWTTGSNMVAWQDNTKYRIIAAEMFDTSVFGNSFYTGNFSSIENDTGGMMRQFLSIQPYSGRIPKDSFECFVLQIFRGDSVHNEWQLSDSIGSFLKMSTVPFPLNQALHNFNLYMNTNHVYRGYTPPTGDLKIGPVFKFSPGDPGWSLHAYSDSVCWFLQLITGSGDCPAGCTEWEFNTFKVTANGVVESPTSEIRNSSTKTFSPALQQNVGARSFFSLQGRRVGKNNSLVRLAKGVYIIAEQSDQGKKTSIISGR